MSYCLNNINKYNNMRARKLLMQTNVQLRGEGYTSGLLYKPIYYLSVSVLFLYALC